MMFLVALAVVFVIVAIAFIPAVKIGVDRDIHIFSQAGIAGTLGPLVEDFGIDPGAEILIIGGNCDNLILPADWEKEYDEHLRDFEDASKDKDHKYPWKLIRLLKRWRKKAGDNGTFRYLVIEPPPEAVPNLRALAKRLGFDLRVIQNADDIADRSTQDLAVASRTRHFALVSSPRMIWLERNHPRGSKVAYDCEFVPPRQAVRDWRYRDRRMQFERLASVAA